MSTRAEAFELARKMAAKKGGNPSEYIKEAYEQIKKKDGTTKTTHTIVEVKKTSGKVGGAIARGGKATGKALGKATWKGVKSSFSKANERKEDFNFLKAPKDRPSDIKTVTKVFTSSPDPIPEIPESVKKVFRFW